MSISASLVKQLRERTGAGMMECKKFLVQANGDIEEAIKEMRKAGGVKADKKADRVAAEGKIFIDKNDSEAVILEVNSETDFVARDESFVDFGNKVAATALQTKVTDVKTLAEQQLSDGSMTVEEARQQLVAKIGENIQLRRLLQVSTEGAIGSYLHGAKIGVMVSLKNGSEDLAKDIAMHIAASNPIVVSKDDVPAEAIERNGRQNERYVW